MSGVAAKMEAEVDGGEAAMNVDAFGFVLDADETKGVTKLKGKKRKDAVAKNRRRESKWLDMMQASQTYQQFRAWRKVVRRCRKGIPDAMRARAWWWLTGAALRKEQSAVTLGDLETTPVTDDHPMRPVLDVIERDLHRTYPAHELFLEQNGIGQSEMRGILRAYAVYDPDLGYCQGMGMVAGVLLMHMPKEQAFWTFAELINNEKYLQGFYLSGLRQIQICTTAMDLLIASKMPALGRHLEANGMSAILYSTDWFMCAFSKTLPWDLVLRIWDMFLCEGRIVLFRVAVAVMYVNRRALRKKCTSMDQLMPYLRHLPRDTCSLPILLPHILEPVASDDAILAAVRQAERQHPPKPQRREERRTDHAGANGRKQADSSSNSSREQQLKGDAEARGQASGTKGEITNNSATATETAANGGGGEGQSKEKTAHTTAAPRVPTNASAADLASNNVDVADDADEDCAGGGGDVREGEGTKTGAGPKEVQFSEGPDDDDGGSGSGDDDDDDDDDEDEPVERRGVETWV